MRRSHAQVGLLSSSSFEFTVPCFTSPAVFVPCYDVCYVILVSTERVDPSHEIFCAWAPRAQTRGTDCPLFDIAARSRARTPHFALIPLFLIPLALFMQLPFSKKAQFALSALERAHARDLLKHEDELPCCRSPKVLFRGYLLRSLDPADHVRVVTFLGEIRWQSNHNS
jgi:hypothetical protein